MNIGIDIRSTLKKTSTGIGRYTLNLIKAISEIDRENSYYLYSRKKFFDFKKRLPRLPGKNFRHAGALPDMSAFHTSSYDLERPRNAKKFIVTIHDVIIKAYPHGHDEETINQVDGQLKKVLVEADLLVADSHNTKSDLLKFYDVSDSKVKVIYPGVRNNDQYSSSEAKIPSRQARRIFLQSREPYILFVGTIEPRKNIQGLIRAFNLLKKGRGIGHKLIIAGMKGWMYEDIFREYESSEFKDDIIFKGYVGDKELAGLYKNASVFVYPSFYEGFGFPILEAFGYGVPVVTSRTSSCGEIAGDGALLISPENYEEISEAISKIINDEELRNNLAQRGFVRAKGFSWENTAREFVKLFA